jgi:hypothetical protein
MLELRTAAASIPFMEARKEHLERVLASSDMRTAQLVAENLNKANMIRALQDSLNLLDAENHANTNLVKLFEGQMQSMHETIL